MDTRQITLIVFDEKRNFHDHQTQLQLGTSLYKKVLLVENANDFKKTFDKLTNQEYFALAVHVFHAPENSASGMALSGIMNFENSNIEKDYHIEGIMVSTGRPEDVQTDIIRKTGRSRAVYMYSQLHDALALERVKTYTKSNLFRPSQDKKNRKITKEKSKVGIFLSHSSKDSDIVNRFREMVLESGLSVPPDQIKFTSAEDNGVHSGISIPEDLRNFLKLETGLFIQFISADYVKSRVCLNEEGAAWCLLPDKMFISIIIPPASFDEISWIKDHNKALKITNFESLLNIYEHRKAFFKRVNITRFTGKVNLFVQIAQSISTP